MRKYTPRRAGKRWLEGAPDYILDCFFHKTESYYDILFCGKLLGVMKSDPQDFAHVYIMGLEVEPSGAWSSFELDAYRATQLRRKDSHRRIKWSDLPTEVKKSVQRWAWAEED